MTNKRDHGRADHIDPATVAAYVAAYPHLRYIAAGLPDLRNVRAFAQNALALAAPPGASPLQIWNMAAAA
jgi:hypothetical protein